MATLDAMSHEGHEQVLYWNDPAAGLRAIIAIHSTLLGPALGGCRMHDYRTEAEALADVLRLSRGMTYKAAAAGVPLGGGKSVIIGDPRRDKSDRLLHSFGRFVDTLGGRYTASEDVGTSQEDLGVMRTESSYISEDFDPEIGDMNSLTALGTFEGIRASVAFVTGSPDVQGLRVAVQGLGHVGWPLCELLADAGCELIVADVLTDRMGAAAEAFGAQLSDPSEILRTPCDILAPCAMGGVVNDFTVDAFACRIVAGCANNVLSSPDIGERLHGRGILLAPDYVINGGGLIAEAARLAGDSFEVARHRVESVYGNVLGVLQAAQRDSVSPMVAADRIAEGVLMEAAVQRER